LATYLDAATPTEAESDYGFGDSFTRPGLELEGADPMILPDEGGVVVALSASYWPGPGPYRVRLRNALNEPFPAIGGCYSAIAGGGDECVARGARQQPDELRFTSPPAPPGLYDIQVEWGTGWSDSATFEGAIRIVRRLRARAAFRIRARFQDLYLTGPAVERQEPLLLP